MSRWWIDLVSSVSDRISLPALIVLAFVAATAIALLWYTFPAWVPRRWPRVPRWPWRLRRKRDRGEGPKITVSQPSGSVSADTDPALAVEDPSGLSVEELISFANHLADQERYAEAVRQRLRAILRAMLDAGVVEHLPGQTVTELAAVASHRCRPVEVPLNAAVIVFSDIWYGSRESTSDDDRRMRALTDQVRQALTVGVLP